MRVLHLPLQNGRLDALFALDFGVVFEPGNDLLGRQVFHGRIEVIGDVLEQLVRRQGQAR